MGRSAILILLAAALVSMSAGKSAAQASAAETAETTAGAKASEKASEAKGSDSGSLYTVKEGDKVDEKTLNGWKTWRALACERCHGAEQEGLVGPALVDSMKVLSKDDFHTVIMNGRPEKGMPPFNASAMVVKNWEGLYAYLKGRSDGQIKPGRLSPIEQP